MNEAIEIKAIVKTEECSDGKERPIIFFPDDWVSNPDLLSCYSFLDSHVEASYKYYLKCKLVKDKKELERIVKHYESLGPEKVKLKLVKRISKKDRLGV